jgi:hypothetical protein
MLVRSVVNNITRVRCNRCIRLTPTPLQKERGLKSIFFAHEAKVLSFGEDLGETNAMPG